MCNATSVKGRFDPGNCPLLAGLSSDERKARMATDPRIRNCIDLIEGKATPSCVTSKLVAAYERRSRARKGSNAERESASAS